MKFAKELEDNAIPEWRRLYFDYKTAKKKLKAVGRAVRNVERSPIAARKSPFGKSSSLRDAPVYSFLGGGRDPTVPSGRDAAELRPRRTRSEAVSPKPQKTDRDEIDGGRTPRARPMTTADERSPLHMPGGRDGAPKLARYGSIIGSPPSGNSPMPDLTPQKTQASLLELPDPALDPAHTNDGQSMASKDDRSVSPGTRTLPPLQLQHPDATQRQLSHTGNAYEVGGSTATLHPARSRYGSIFFPKRTASAPSVDRPPFLQRVLSASNGTSLKNKSSPLRPRNTDVALEAYREADFRQAEFFLFLDKQLVKIEDFYRIKEEEATRRLNVLREQLHILRNRRMEDIVAAEQRQPHGSHHLGNGGLSFAPANTSPPLQHGDDSDLKQSDGPDHSGDGVVQGIEHSGHSHRWASVTSQVDNALDKVRTGRVGKTSKAMEELGTPAQMRLDPGNQDYVRRHPKETRPPYRVAKRKLKSALQEYYRSLELLKSYALLNRTAFRKINKKFDKAISAPSGMTMRYMTEKVNKAHFVNSDIIDGHIQAVEDLYARYFERGNRKVAIGKLRGKVLKIGDYTGPLCRAGLFLGSGIVLGIQGVVYGSVDLFDPDPLFQIRSSYLMQIYAGYFLLLLLVGLFCVDARIFSRAKVNYQFIFELDPQHVLDWRQLIEIPSVFFFLLSLTMYLNFTLRAGGSDMYIYWPVVLVGLSVIIMLLPPPLFYWHARKWFLYSLWRLVFAGLYPVEFRDFFLGDMFCSETYAMGNIELFFCLYATRWGSPPMCNSSNSRLLGFFSTLPGIWRALQCIKRYRDTGNKFPHLANCAKYVCTITMYMSLSLFRINKTRELKAFFIAAASINSLYCSFWDVYYDWSLGRGEGKHPLLRQVLAFKRHVWFYYVAMIIDPILRFNWVFYAIFANDLQHSSIISFAVALSEACRRGLWTILRVENEHCTNVLKNRVVREVDLPYQQDRVTQIDGALDGVGDVQPSTQDEESRAGSAQSTATEQRPALQSSASFLRQRKQSQSMQDSPVAQALRRVGSTLATAHAQDYEKKRRPVQSIREEQDSDDEEEDDEDEAETAAAQDAVDRAR